MTTPNAISNQSVQDVGRRIVWMEVALLVTLWFVYAGTPPPAVNEAHYLTKARHFWNPDWCAGDIFLDSADAHAVFYAVVGWPSRWLSLASVAWFGRLVAWIGMAWAWQRLSWAVIPRRWVSVLSGAWFLVWMDSCHLAGEWAVGGIEAKSLAYVCVVSGLWAAMIGRWNAVWLWFGAASAFHVLVGGWSVLAMALGWCLAGADRPALSTMWRGLVGGFVLSLGGLIPALQMNWGVDSATAARANMIYVFGRLSHHLVWREFAAERWRLFGLMCAAWIVVWWFARHSRAWMWLHRFALGSVCIAATGMAIDAATAGRPALAAEWLRYYWYRLADVAVPMCVASGLMWIVVMRAPRRPVLRGMTWGLALLIPGYVLGRIYVEHQQDFRPGAVVQAGAVGPDRLTRLEGRYRAWRAACAWIAEHTRPEDRFLTPRQQQSFKWYAQRAEVVCWKDLPQDPASVVEWWHILQDVYPPNVAAGGLGVWSDEQLQAIAEEHRVQYIVLDRARRARPLGFVRVYPESPTETAWFEVYRVASHD